MCARISGVPRPRRALSGDCLSAHAGPLGKLYVSKAEDRDQVIVILARNGYTVRQGKEKDVPLGAAEYVVFHEFAHLLQPDHSAAFYRILDEVLPDWRDRRRILKNF